MSAVDREIPIPTIAPGDVKRGAAVPARAMVLAAGRGERMRPLTDTTPKPLLVVRGKPLLRHTLEALARGGVDRVVVNTAWLEERISSVFGQEPRRYGPGALLKSERQESSGGLPSIVFSHEGRDFGGALETAGGIARALPLLADVFWLAAGDVHAPEFEFASAAYERFAASGQLAHLYLVPNPPQHPQGDFGIDAASGLALRDAPEKLTYSTIGLYRKAFFASLPDGNPQGLKCAMLPLLQAAMDNRRVTAERYDGPWADIGTPERLAQINQDPASTP